MANMFQRSSSSAADADADLLSKKAFEMARQACKLGSAPPIPSRQSSGEPTPSPSSTRAPCSQQKPPAESDSPGQPPAESEPPGQSKPPAESEPPGPGRPGQPEPPATEPTAESSNSKTSDLGGEDDHDEKENMEQAAEETEGHSGAGLHQQDTFDSCDCTCSPDLASLEDIQSLLCVAAPWARLLASGKKTWELRPYPTRKRCWDTI